MRWRQKPIGSSRLKTTKFAVEFQKEVTRPAGLRAGFTGSRLRCRDERTGVGYECQNADVVTRFPV